MSAHVHRRTPETTTPASAPAERAQRHNEGTTYHRNTYEGHRTPHLMKGSPAMATTTYKSYHRPPSDNDKSYCTMDGCTSTRQYQPHLWSLSLTSMEPCTSHLMYGETAMTMYGNPGGGGRGAGYSHHNNNKGDKRGDPSMTTNSTSWDYQRHQSRQQYVSGPYYPLDPTTTIMERTTNPHSHEDHRFPQYVYQHAAAPTPLPYDTTTRYIPKGYQTSVHGTMTSGCTLTCTSHLGEWGAYTHLSNNNDNDAKSNDEWGGTTMANHLQHTYGRWYDRPPSTTTSK